MLECSLFSPLFGTIPSSSSKKIIQGDDCFAFLKICRKILSESPNHLENKLGPLMEIKFTPLSFASAFAIKVFPVPEGPTNNIPYK